MSTLSTPVEISPGVAAVAQKGDLISAPPPTVRLNPLDFSTLSALERKNQELRREVEKSLSARNLREEGRSPQRLAALKGRVSRLRAEVETEKRRLENEKTWLKILADTSEGEERERKCIRRMMREVHSSPSPQTEEKVQQVKSLSLRLEEEQREKIQSLVCVFLAQPGGIEGTLSLPGREAEIRAFCASPLEPSLCQLMKFLQLAIRYLSIDFPDSFFPCGLGSVVRTGEGEVPLFDRPLSRSGGEGPTRIVFRAYASLVAAAGEVARKIGSHQEEERPFLFLWDLGRTLGDRATAKR